MTETTLSSFNHTELTTTSTRYHNGLTLQYVEDLKAFYIFKKGRQVSCIMPAETTTMETFRGMLELLNKEEDYR